jgi:hypothetical protein
MSGTTLPHVGLSVFVGLALSAVATQADSIISVNLTDFATDVQQIDADESYGIAAEGSLTDGWVNLNRTLAASDLLFADGSASTVSTTLTAPNSWGSFNAAYDDTPMRGGIDDYTGTVNPTSISFANLAANFPAGYKAIVYLTGFNGNTGASISDGTTTFFYQTDGSPAPGAPVITTDTVDDGVYPVAQYAVFGGDLSPLNADTITFTLDTLAGGGSGLGGVQLVAIPEPATVSILGLGLAVLALRCRR